MPIDALARALDERSRPDIAPLLPQALTPIGRKSRMTSIGSRMTRLIERSRIVLRSILDEMFAPDALGEREILRAMIADHARPDGLDRIA